MSVKNLNAKKWQALNSRTEKLRKKPVTTKNASAKNWRGKNFKARKKPEQENGWYKIERY